MKVLSVIIALAIGIPLVHYFDRNGDIVGCLSLILSFAFYGFLLVMIIVILATL